MRTKAVLFTGPDRVAVDTADVPDPGPGEVLIEAAYTCISPGTELRCLAGKQPGQGEWPFIPGYALAGRVVARGAGVALLKGAPVLCAGTARADRSRCWGGHVGLAVQPESRVYPLPEGIGLLEASLAPLAAIAYHGLRLSRPAPLEKVVVVGLGPIGQLSARVHAAAGADVVGADLSPERAQALRNTGIPAVTPEGSLADAFRELFPGGADIVVDATGAPGALQHAVKVAKDLPWEGPFQAGARLLVQGSYPADFPVPYQEAFAKELSIHIPRNYQPRDLREVLELIRRGALSVRDLVSEVRPPEDAPEVYAALRRGDGGMMTAVFRWGPE